MSSRAVRTSKDFVASLRKAQERELEAVRLSSATEVAGRIRQRRGQRERARARRSRWFGLTAAVVAVAALGSWFRPDRRPLDFVVGPKAARGTVGAWVMAETAETIPLVFSDGTTMNLAPQTRARVRSLGPSGAEVALERGTIRAAVVPRTGGDWLVTVGPFDVQVKGTKFEVSWDPVIEAFDLTMHEGAVVVSGACLAAPRQATGNETLSLSCPRTRPISSAAASEVPIASETASGASPALGATATATATAASSPPSATVYGQNDAWHSTADEALELGNIARLSSRASEAIGAYDAVRVRFAGTDAAAMAAFHRGQVAFDVQGDLADARRWFQIYLAERPEGALAREAMGRQLECEQRLSLDAHETAARYLERFPDGPRAPLARSALAQ